MPTRSPWRKPAASNPGTGSARVSNIFGFGSSKNKPALNIRRTIAVALALTSSVRAQDDLTVAAAADAAVRNYPSIRVSAEQVNAAAAGIQLARTAYLPRVEALAQANRATRNNIFGLMLPQGLAQQAHYCAGGAGRDCALRRSGREAHAVDIFPEAGEPAVRWHDPAQLEDYITYYYECHFLYVRNRSGG